jgi:hypothetical protein
MSLKDLITAIVGAKQTVASLDERISKLNRERREIEQAPPHRDDLIAWVKRGLDEASKNFLTNLRWHWNEDALSRQSGMTFGEGCGPQLLALNNGKPSDGHATLWLSHFGHSDDRRFSLGNAGAAITHFMRQLMEPQIPDLNDRCFPNASKGLRHADRMKRIDEIDAAIEKALAERDELRTQLASAHATAASHVPAPIEPDPRRGVTLESMRAAADPELRAAAARR